MWLLLIGVLLFAAETNTAQTDLKKRQHELERLRKTIEEERKKLDDLQKNERATVRSLSTTEKQQQRTANLIRQLEEHIGILGDSINTIEQRLDSAAILRAQLRDKYSTAMQAMLAYSKRRQGIPEGSLLNDNVYRSLHANVRSYNNRLKSLGDSLEREQQALKEYSATEEHLRRVREQEHRRLLAATDQNRKALQKLRSDKKAVADELKTKERSLRKLQGHIRDLITRQEKARQAERKKAESATPRPSPRSSEPSTQQPAPSSKHPHLVPRSLPWPTASRELLHGYGAYRSPDSKSEFDNPGLDISVPVGSPVSSVADGEVSSISWLPGLGSVVIVDHGQGFRSVYANLSSVAVSIGNRISRGAKLGLSGEGVDGPYVHFEMWSYRQRLNPSAYLK